MSKQMREANVSGYVRAGISVMKILTAMAFAMLVGCDGEAYTEWSKEREARKEAERFGQNYILFS